MSIDLQSLEGLLNRVAAFGAAGESEECRAAVAELEAAAAECTVRPPLLSDDAMGLCADLLESLPPASPALRALLMLLSNLALRDENRQLCVRFGAPLTCVVLLQHVDQDVPPNTLYYVFDLISTVAASDGAARLVLRPSIPYILRSFERHPDCADVLLGACFALSTLALSDAGNCELIAQRGGIDVLVAAFRAAVVKGKELAQRQQRPQPASRVGGGGARHKEAELQHCYAGIARWAKDVLLKVCLAPAALEVVDERLASADFGTYGSCIEVDELKWALLFERKKVKKQAAAVPK